MRLLLAAALVCAASAGATASQELCAAAFDGNHEAVKKSLSNGVDVDYPCLTAAGTFTALHIASYHGHTEVLKVVLSWGAHANVVDSQGFHALYNAAGRNHGEIVRLLLENSEVNPFEATFNPGGFTVLHIAANHGHVAALEVLLEDGRLPIDGLDDEGRTPLYVAALNGHDEAVALLKEAERKGPAREQASEAFCVAAKRGDLKAVKKSLSNGIDVGYLCETTGATALWIASRAGHVDIVKLLISLGADTSVMEEGFHALYVAAQKGHPEVVRLLLEQVNPFDAISPKGFTALHVAARQTSIEALDTLLDDGRLPVDILSNDGQTSLYTAAREGSLRSVEVLLRHGADASFRKNGKTPADIASQSGHHEVAALLKEAEGRTPSERFCAAVVDGDVEALELTIRQGVDIEYQCPAAGTAGDASAASAAQSRIEALNGTETALYIASRAGHTDIVDVLLREGAAVNSPEGHTEVPGTTALHAAAGWGQTEVVELLLRAGGNASQGDAEGYTPLDNAASWGHQEVVAVLLDEAKVDVKSHDAKGAPMYYAAKYGRVEVIKLLLERGADPNLGPPAGSHPLYVAAEENHSDVVRVLLEVVDPHRAAWNSFSPLHVAAWHNCTEALEILVDDGRLPVDVLSTDGQSPLYVAARQGALRSVEALLRHGADASIGGQRSPADVASVNGHYEVAVLLKEAERKAAASEEFCDDADHGDLEAVKKSVRNGADLKLFVIAVKQSPITVPIVLWAIIVPLMVVLWEERKRWQEINMLVVRIQCLWRRRKASRRLVEKEREAAAREREARERDAAAARALEEREREAAAALEAAREREAAEREAAARQRREEAARAAAATAEAKSEEPLGRAESKAEPAPEGYEIVARVLEHLGESHLLSTFEAQQIDDDALPFLEPSDLLDLGVAPMTCLAILGAAAASGKAKKLEGDAFLDDVATHQCILENELREHRAELERLRISRGEVPPDLECSITHELMRDPVFAADGNTYERVAIEQWLSTGARTSPTTNEPLDHLTLTPNHMARRLITALLEERRARD